MYKHKLQYASSVDVGFTTISVTAVSQIWEHVTVGFTTISVTTISQIWEHITTTDNQRRRIWKIEIGDKGPASKSAVWKVRISHANMF